MTAQICAVMTARRVAAAGMGHYLWAPARRSVPRERCRYADPGADVTGRSGAGRTVAGMGRAELCERLLRCAAGARVATGRLECWEGDQQFVLEEIYEQARGGLAPTVPKRVAARVLEISVSTLDRWIARGAIDTGGSPRSGRQEVATDMVLELACELERVTYRGPDRFRLALGRVWCSRLDADTTETPLDPAAAVA